MTTEAIVTRAAEGLTTQDITAADVVSMFLQWQDVCDESAALYGRALRQFFIWVQHTGRQTATLTQADIVAYKKNLLNGYTYTAANGETIAEAAKSPLTAASYLNAVKLFYKWLHNQNGIIKNIAADVKPPKRENKFERRPLQADKAAELLAETAATASLRDNAIIELLITSGLRTIEVCRANIRDIKHRGDDAVLYVQGKGDSVNKRKVAFISGDTYAAITKYLQTERPNAAPEEPLFTCAGNRNKGGRLTTRTISGIARQHLDAIGLCHNFGERNSEFTAHSLRHTFGCTMLKASNYNYRTAQLLLRHRNPATTQAYVHTLDEENMLAAAKQYDIDKIYKSATNE